MALLSPSFGAAVKGLSVFACAVDLRSGKPPPQLQCRGPLHHGEARQQARTGSGSPKWSETQLSPLRGSLRLKAPARSLHYRRRCLEVAPKPSTTSGSCWRVAKRSHSSPTLPTPLRVPCWQELLRDISLRNSEIPFNFETASHTEQGKSNQLHK